jgi:ribosomal peptide maturation radical SAM protein 1
MPWGSVLKPSLALAILKQCVARAGYAPDLHFLNIRFAEYLGLRLYEQISDRSFFHPEWFFSQLLFGRTGLGELNNRWEELKADPSASELAEMLKDMAGSEEMCARIAADYVPRFMDECMSNIDWNKYMAVGFTTTFAQSLSSLALAKRIKERSPATPIIFGGANVDSAMGVEFMRAFPWIDYVVHGEAEESFPALLDHIAHGCCGDRVPGVSMRREQQIFPGDHDARPIADLNDSPSPDYSDYIAALEQAGFKKKMKLRLYFESSRGCWWGAKHHCTFCGLNGTAMAFRRKDAGRVCSEITSLAAEHQCLTFSATDNILATEYFSQLLPRLAEMDVDLSLFYEVKANLSRKQLELLRAAGVREIQPGIESLNSGVLRLMRKGITAIQNIQLLKWCFEYEIAPLYNILFGFPGEGRDVYSELPDIFRLLGHLQPPSNVQQVIFERFSPYHFEREKFGLSLQPIDLYRFIFPPSRVNLENIAYYFAGEWDKRLEPQEAIRPALEAWQTWEKQWRSRQVFCHYEKGPNYIVIHDNRPRTSGAAPEYRRVCLNQHVSALYLFCDQSRSRQAIVEMMNHHFGSAVSQHSLDLWLDQLVLQNLLYRENDRYLALAVRKRTALPVASVSVAEQEQAAVGAN